jgi:isopenicillin N synthase-like dioxygenase
LKFECGNMKKPKRRPENTKKMKFRSSFLVMFALQLKAFGVFSSAITTVIPVIDISLLKSGREVHFCEDIASVADQIHSAAKEVGFFYVSHHGIPDELVNSLIDISNQFFDLSSEEKYRIAMTRGGKAWRGFFGVGDETTSGIPDQKEGIYFGTEVSNDDPRPMHGANQWPQGELGNSMKHLVLTYLTEMKTLGRLLMKAISCSLEITEPYFLEQFDNPTELFRIFHYPPHNGQLFSNASQGVGEHTDYGYLTILKQDASGGLQVRSLQDPEIWIEAPPIEGTFVINLGDALEHNTKGLYRATPHRVLQRIDAESGRISMPYFFDPSFDSEMRSMVPYFGKDIKIPSIESEKRVSARWDKLDPTLFQGTYGSYLLRKVSKAFPSLFEEQFKKQEL